jgi:hypothetical protein
MSRWTEFIGGVERHRSVIVLALFSLVSASHTTRKNRGLRSAKVVKADRRVVVAHDDIPGFM